MGNFLNNCQYCKSINTKVYDLGYNGLTHLDFSDISTGHVIYECKDCHLIFSSSKNAKIKQVDKILYSQEYSESSQTDHKVYSSEYNGHVTRGCLQTSIIADYISNNSPVVLDIGCFDGMLLREFRKKWKNADLHGYDINPSLERFFPGHEKIYFHVGDFEKLEGKYDVICFSHSLMYFQDVRGMLRKVKNLMSNDGLLFIQVPNICKNPSYVLMGDQYTYFTENSLKSLFANAGFSYKIHSTVDFPREIIGIGQLFDQEAKSKVSHKGGELSSVIAKLKCLEANAKKISSEGGFGILGTTAVAAFLESAMSNKIKYFVDECTSTEQTHFRDKPVLHPKELSSQNKVILPFFTGGERLLKRFQSEYLASFYLINEDNG